MVTNMLNSKYKIALYLTFFVGFFLMGACGFFTAHQAYAAQQKEFTIEQISSVEYCGKDFVIDGSFCDTDENVAGLNNELFSSLRFSYDGDVINSIQPGDVTILTNQAICDPGRYVCAFSVEYEEETYVVSATTFNIDKRTVVVTTFLNGMTNLVVEEGADIVLSYNYQNAIPSHTYQEPHDGYSVTVIDSKYLTCPAWTDVDIVKPIYQCSVSADHAESKYYTFQYNSSYLTIVGASTSMLEYSSNGQKLLVMAGDFSVLNTVNYTDIGINPTSSEFAIISANADVLYKDSGFFDKYEKAGCFTVEVFYNNNIVLENVPATFTVKASGLSGSKNYKIIAMYNNGRSEILDAKYKDGYISFYGSDVGTFIIVSEIEGLSMTHYALVIAGGVAFLIIIILLFAVFRKKY